MGLFNQFKQAMTPSNIRAGLRSGMSSMANPGQALASHGQLQAYGQEMQRIKQVGIRGTGIVRSVTPVSGAQKPDPNLDWMTVETEITVPGKPTLIARNDQLVPTVTAHLYAPGTTHNVAVDPADPHRYTFIE